MNIVSPPEAIRQITPLNPFDRFPDGRPRVPDDLLARMKTITSEEAWAILDREKYSFQFEGDWFRTHPDRILVGRAGGGCRLETESRRTFELDLWRVGRRGCFSRRT